MSTVARSCFTLHRSGVIVEIAAKESVGFKRSWIQRYRALAFFDACVRQVIQAAVR